LSYPGNSKKYDVSSNSVEFSESNFRDFIENFPEPAWLWNVQTGKITLTNKLCEALSIPSEKHKHVSADTWNQLVHPDDLPKFNKIIQRLISQRDFEYKCECRMQRSGNSYLWTSISGTVVGFDSSGSPELLLGTLTDIQHVKDKEHQLVKNSEILTRIPNIIFGTDSSGKIIFSENTQNLVSSKSTLINHHKDIIDYLHIEERLEFSRKINEASSNRYSFQFKCRLCDSGSKNWRWHLITGNPVHYSYNGENVGWLFVCTNIEDLAKEISRLEESNEREHRLNHAKANFLSMMSHELRTPLNSILGPSYLLSASEIDDEQKYLVSLIQQGGEHMLNLVTNILEMSQSENFEIKLHREWVSIHELLRHRIKPVTEMAKNKGLGFRLEIAPDLPKIVHVDPTALAQILINLIGNSTKFTEEGFIQVHICYLHKDEKYGNSEICIYVRDTGIGIKDDFKSKLFQPFEQADKGDSRSKGGTGIGLYISRNYARAMGGDLKLESTGPRGTTFELKIPVNANEIDDHDAK